MVEAILLSRPALWCARPIVVTVRGPDGKPVVTHVDKPFARVGSHPDCEVVLRGDDVPGQCLYLHATDQGIYCLGLRSGNLAPAPPNGWLRPKVHARLGPYRINAGFDDDGPPPRHIDLDPRARGSAAGSTLRLRIESPGEQQPVVEKSWRRQLTLVGRMSPSTLRLVHPKVSKIHCILFRDRDMLWAVDLLSSRGTRIEGGQIEAAQVLSGEVLEVGPIRLTYLGAGDDNEAVGFSPAADSGQIFTTHQFGPATFEEPRQGIDQVTLRPGHPSEEAEFLRKRSARFETELAEARRALADGRQDAQVRTALSEQLAIDLGETRARLATVEEQLKQARQQNQDQQSRLELQEADRQAAGGRLAAELESLRAELTQAAQERVERQAADASARETLTAEVDRLAAELAQAREQLEQAQRHHQQQIEELEAERGERQQGWRELEQQLAGVEQGRWQIENELAAERARCVEMERKLADADGRRVELDQQLAAEGAGAAKMELTLAGLDKRAGQLEHQLAAERARSAKLEQELLQERTQQASETGDAERSRLLAEQLGHAEQQLAQADQKLATAVEQLAAAGQRLDGVEHQWADAEEQRADFEKQLVLAQRQAADAEQQRADTEQQRADTERQLKAASEQLLTLQAESQRQALELAAQIERATAEQAALQLEFDGDQREAAARQAEIARQLAGVESLSGRLREELDQATARRVELESVTEQLAARLNEQQAIQAELEQALADQRLAAEQLERALAREREAHQQAGQAASEAALAAERQRASMEHDWRSRYQALLGQQVLDRSETERLRLEVEQESQLRQSLEAAGAELTNRLKAVEAMQAQREQALEQERRARQLDRGQLESQLAAERQAVERRIAEAHESQEQLSRKHETLDQELKRQHSAASQLQLQLEAATAERDEANSACDQLAGRLAEAKADRDELGEQLTLRRRSADEQGQRVGELEAALQASAADAQHQVARLEERCRLLRARCRRTVQVASRFRGKLEQQSRMAAAVAAANASPAPEQLAPSAPKPRPAATEPILPAAQRGEPRRAPVYQAADKARTSGSAAPASAPAEAEADELFLDQLLDLHAGSRYGKRRLLWIALGGAAALAAVAGAVAVFGRQLFGG